MDTITLAMAKQYTNSQRLAYTEGGGSLIWDGNTEGMVNINNTFYRVSNKVYDASTINAVYLSDGVVIIPETGDVDDFYGDGSVISFCGDTVLFITVAKEYDGLGYADVGTYFLHLGEERYVSSVTFKETIHTIDPKYLPGVCLPVVELSTVIAESGTALTEAENAALTEAYESGLPIVCKFSYEEDGVGFSQNGVFQRVASDGIIGYVMNSLYRVWILIRRDATWGVIYDG